MVVMAGDRVAGILSERDLVRAMARDGAGCLERPVEAYMTADVIFARPQESVDELMERMTDRRIRHLPVCENDRLLGIISIGDVVKTKIAETVYEAETLKAYIVSG
jgi:CBS domain-containing protein